MQQAIQTAFSITVFDGSEKPKEIDLNTFRKNTVTFGRSRKNDIVLSSGTVSRMHGRFFFDGASLIVEDTGSTNGLIVNGLSVQQCSVKEGDILRIDDWVESIQDGVLIVLHSNNSRLMWKHFEIQNLNEISIGRDPNCTITLEHVGASKIHAIIRKQGNEAEIWDKNSTNGTFINGRRVDGKLPLKEKDIIIITNTKLIFTNEGVYCCTYLQGISVDAVHIVKTIKNQKKYLNICNDVSLSIHPGELVAIIGGSGAGKTTFMNAISGYQQPTSGQVLINGEKLYETYDALKNSIGYVPQQDIVYDNLTLFSMLEYAAKLRLPDDIGLQERKKRVKTVIDIVELNGKEETMIRQLSGGQKKRASIAVELLSDPYLFFLDEPASGLDPGTERNLMHTLKNMTSQGKTIILVTHSTLNLQECDKIVFMGKGGNLCFFGNAKEAKRFFEVDNLVDVYNMITEDSIRWREKYDSFAPPENLQLRHQKPHSSAIKSAAGNKHSRCRQTAVLSSRYFQLLINDRQRLLMLLLQAPILALFISFVKDGHQFEYYGITKSLLFALSCSAFWIGTLNAIQEVCKERNILHREYMTGLRLGPYIISKFVVLGVLCLLQAVMLIAVFVITVGKPEEGAFLPAIAELFITVFLTAFSAAAMGIFASSLFKNPDRAMTVAPILLMPQILFSGLLFKLDGITKAISWFAVCRWSMEGLGTTADLNNLKYMVEIDGKMTEIQREAETFFEFTKSHIIQSWLILTVFAAGFGILSAIALKSIKKNK